MISSIRTVGVAIALGASLTTMSDASARGFGGMGGLSLSLGRGGFGHSSLGNGGFGQKTQGGHGPFGNGIGPKGNAHRQPLRLQQYTGYGWYLRCSHHIVYKRAPNGQLYPANCRLVYADQQPPPFR